MKILSAIERGIKWTGNIIGVLILIITVIIVYEVVARYAFNAPTSWAWLLNKQIFGVYVLFSGSYALISKTHIRIEVFYEHFPKWFKKVIHWLSLLAGILFLGSLLWKSTLMGLEAWEAKEKAVGVFKIPLYPLKIVIPIGTTLFILACLVVYLKQDPPNKEGLK